jgi:ribonuclease HII
MARPRSGRIEIPFGDDDPPPEGVCGLDEAGRGPLAGPVFAAAVILPSGFPLHILDDSKKLREAERLVAFKAIVDRARWGIASCSPAEIDELNILKASLLAMARALDALMEDGLGLPPLAIADGLHVPADLPCPARALVKADATVPAVMAASILAKVARDRAMERWGWIYPEYGYGAHKGYPTAAHARAIREHGPSPIQRMSFRVPSEPARG